MFKGLKAKGHSYQFHPLELGFVGYSGVGKTTLLTQIIALLKDDWKLAFVKHDAHRFEVDKEDKDSFRATEAGASSSFISNAEHFAWMAQGSLPYFSQRSIFLDYDALLIEGHKALAIDKVVVLDRDYSVLNALPDESLATVLAYVGEAQEPQKSLPWNRPYFQRDDIAGIAQWVEEHWQAKLNLRPMKGLVLAGGLSTRMGEDKGRLRYHNKPQAIQAFETLEALGVSSYLSLRDGQWTSDERADYPIIEDQFKNLGPMGGILSAMNEDPQAAWVVIACDLPLLGKAPLEQLLQNRQAQKLATAYRSSSDNLPEPLCAIYEPNIRLRLFEALGLGLSCPRKVLINSNTLLLEPYDDRALTNVNTAEEYRNIRSMIEENTL